MSLHIYYDHQCPDCQAHYIPCDTDISCPKCGLLEKERFDFIPKATKSAKYQLKRFGYYTPPVWLKKTLADHILLCIFYVLDNYYKNPSKEATFMDVSKSYLDQEEFETDQEYMKDHILTLSCRVYETLQDNDN